MTNEQRQRIFTAQSTLADVYQELSQEREHLVKSTDDKFRLANLVRVAILSTELGALSAVIGALKHV